MMSEGRIAGVDPLDKEFSEVIAEFPRPTSTPSLLRDTPSTSTG